MLWFVMAMCLLQTTSSYRFSSSSSTRAFATRPSSTSRLMSSVPILSTPPADSLPKKLSTRAREALPKLDSLDKLIMDTALPSAANLAVVPIVGYTIYILYTIYTIHTIHTIHTYRRCRRYLLDWSTRICLGPGWTGGSQPVLFHRLLSHRLYSNDNCAAGGQIHCGKRYRRGIGPHS